MVKARSLFLLRIVLALTALLRLVQSSPFEPHKRPRHGPWFEGWFTRIIDTATGRSAAVILGAFQGPASLSFTEAYTALLVGRPDGSMQSEHAFLQPGDLSITNTNAVEVDRQPSQGTAPSFIWKSSVGKLEVSGNHTSLDFRMPSGLGVSAELSGRVPWDVGGPDVAGPEGWAAHLPAFLLPTHYFVHSLASPATYSITGLGSGSGYAHQEANYGSFFPNAWTWTQGIDEEAKSQLLLTGGAFTIAGITANQYIVAIRSARHSWNFRSIDFDSIVASPDSCNGSLHVSARSRDDSRRLEVYVAAPMDTFSDSIFVPTRRGFSDDPGSMESYTAKATVNLYEAGSDEPIETVTIDLAALEFGGGYRCKVAPTRTLTSSNLAFGLPPSALVGRAPSQSALTAAHTWNEPLVKLANFPAQGRFRKRRYTQRNSLGVSQSSFGIACIAAALASVLGLRRKRGAGKRTLQEGIANFYDSSSAVWVEIWGEHMHHGYYPAGFKGGLEAHKLAQVDMIERTLSWARIPEPGTAGAPKTILDVGCGVGGSSRYLQKKYQGTTTGITLSPKQRALADQLSARSNQSAVCGFKVADALNMPFADNTFDLVWSFESGEHMPDKAKFMSEMYRVCKPGGRVILVTWVHRNLDVGEKLRPEEVKLFDDINTAYHLPAWCSIDRYSEIAKHNLGMSDIRTDDWTAHITHFWGAVIRSALMPRGWWALLRGGWETFRGALVMPLMTRGYNTGTIRFGLLTGTKSANSFSSPSNEVVMAEKLGDATTLAAVATTHASPNLRRIRNYGWGATGKRSFVSKVRQRFGPPRQDAIARFSSSVRDRILTIYDFSRPHTLIGTLLSIPTIHLFAAMPMLATLNTAQAAVAWTWLATFTVAAVVPALLINIYITGLNQIYDVEIDRVNKPFLVIPAGRLSVRGAWLTVVGCLASAVALAWSYPIGINGWSLHLTLAASAVLGTAYSAPPIRLKRSPFFAAFCIIVVRGLVVNLGFYYYATATLSRLLGLPAAGMDLRGLLSGGFFAVFGLVIALLKDVPDVLGDEMAGLRSLSIRIGTNRVFNASANILQLLLAAVAMSFGVAAAANALAWDGPFSLLLVLSRGLVALAATAAFGYIGRSRQDVDSKDPDQVYGFYMKVWKVFYSSYVCLPLAR